MVYHSTNYVVLVGDTTYALDNPSMAATADQRHVDQLMETIHQLKETKNILGDQIIKISETNTILARQEQEENPLPTKNEIYHTKLDLTGYCWNHGWRVTKGHNIRYCKTKKEGHKYGQKNWEDQRTTRIGVQCGG